MSLTTCPDCGHEVSTTAAACPNCGYTMNTATAPAGTPPPATPDAGERVVYEKRGPGIGTVILGLLVVAVLVVAALWYMGVLRFV